MQSEYLAIAEMLGVTRTFDAAEEAKRRAEFLADYLRASACRSYVLGISGGVDSLTAGLLTQAAVEKLRLDGYDASFIAMRLPYGVQADEIDAQKALAVIRPDRTVTVDIKPAADSLLESVKREAADLFNPASVDFHLGNIKARQRMVAQYALAGATRGLVIGTDHAAEALMGFYTKFGDGAADVLPLAGLTKRRVRAIADHLGAPRDLIFKVPTADLESNTPLRPDEHAYGVTYDEIDDFLEGKAIADPSLQRILATHTATAHKRRPPMEPDSASEARSFKASNIDGNRVSG